MKLPNPAKEVKIDTKTFKQEAGDFKVNERTYRVCETPHFKVLYMKPTDPMDIAELAERLWIDTAFFHSTFIPKWVDRKMAILLVNDQEAYEDAGSWFADMVAETGTPEAKESAERIRKTWPQSAAGGIQLPQAQADEQKVFGQIRVIRAFRQQRTIDGNGKITVGKPQPIKGVWVPFNTNILASDMIDIQADRHRKPAGVRRRGRRDGGRCLCGLHRSRLLQGNSAQRKIRNQHAGNAGIR